MSPRKKSEPIAEPPVAVLEDPHVPSDEGEALSELEVQQLLEARDREPWTPPASIPCPHCDGTGRLAIGDVAPPPPSGPHALDAAPENSKIVVVLLDGKSHAVLATPSGAKELPVGDRAHRLPEGARIVKLLDGQGYEATQMSPTVDYPPLRTATAGEAIVRFIDHFHPHGLS